MSQTWVDIVTGLHLYLVTVPSIQFGLLVRSHAVFPCFTGYHGYLSLRL